MQSPTQSPIPYTIHQDADTAVRAVAAEIAALIQSRNQAGKKAILGLATGSTPTGVYRELVRLHQEEGLSFSQVLTFNLDEYWGLDDTHPQSYRMFMNQNLFDKVDIPLWNTYVLNGKTRYSHWECAAFEAKILASGGINLWLLGIGANGHIAFNEPGSTVDSRTRLVHLSPETIQANSDGRFFKHAAEVPHCALSAGIGTIREAQRIILLALGKNKAAGVHAALRGPFSPECPASMLQGHPGCAFVLDEEAAQLIH